MSNYSLLYVQGEGPKNVFHILCGISIKGKLLAIYNLKQNIFWIVVSNIVVA